jgi:hypothetical protein
MTKKIFISLFLCAFLSGCTMPFSGKNVDSEALDQDSDYTPVEEENSQEGYSINLTSPNDGQVLKSPFLVGGVANVSSDVVYVRVKKPNGDIVISEQTKVKKEANEKSGAFGVLINFVFQSTESGTVEVYGIDEKTKKEIALQSVKVNFDITSSENIQK